MYEARKAANRWIVASLFVALVSATSALAEVKFSQVGSADAADHLFGSVVDQGANPRSTEGTVTETATQARAVAVVAPPSVVVPAAIVTITEPPGVRPAPGPSPRAARVTVPAIRAGQEIRQLRQENQALKKLLADLTDRVDITAGRPEVTLKRPGHVSLAAMVAFRQTE
jgi:hypothetical protein